MVQERDGSNNVQVNYTLDGNIGGLLAEKILMKIKITLSLFVLSVVLLGALVLVIIRQRSGTTSDILFDYVRDRELSQFHPKFTQIKRVTLRQVQPDRLQLTIQMAAPLRLKPRDRLLVRVSVLTTRSYGTSTSNGSNQMEIVFPIGYTYASSPPLPSGSAGIVIYSSAGHKLLAQVPCSFDKAALTAIFNRDLLEDSNLPWAERFTDADVLYTPGSAGGEKAYQKGITMGSSNSHVDAVQLERGAPRSRVVPEHPSSSWKDEKPTILPPVVRAKP